MSERVLVLKYGACSHAKCIFCGYGRIGGKKPVLWELRKDFDSFFHDLKGADTVKVFGSGSFFDERQMPAEARRYFIEGCEANNIKRIYVESRPEYLTEEALKDFSGTEYSVAMGLESADDAILDRISKGFHLKDYEKAAATVRACGGKVRTYLLVNLPYVKDQAKTLEKSVDYALKHSDTIVLINLLPHGNTPVFRLWLRGEWNFLSRDEFFAATAKWKDNPRIDLDAETFRFVPKFPKEAQEKLAGVGEEYLTHPHYEVWQDYLQRWYRPPEEKDILLFLPCTFSKPYSQSKTHQAIIEAERRSGLYPKIHEVMLSNAGLIPREFEDLYPFNAYDWDESLETDEIKKRYIEVITRRIKKYLTAHKGNYKKVLCFLKYSSESYQGLEKACADLGIQLTNLLSRETYEKVKNEPRPLQDGLALDNLYENLMKEK